jgi:hypothetical protein
MCLQVVFELDAEERKNLANGLGWKSVPIIDGEAKLHHGYYPLNKWLKAKNKQIGEIDGSVTYTSAFHIFLKKQDAIDYCGGRLVRVKFRKIRGIGIQYSDDEGHTVLADEMLMIKKKRKK